ncbi:hypothetical protein RZS08_64905, partial [Arthrospira platensis SPKY1]|nr:hypothetical protein [Arthrospira platensis SPKY1]
QRGACVTGVAALLDRLAIGRGENDTNGHAGRTAGVVNVPCQKVGDAGKRIGMLGVSRPPVVALDD